MRLVENVKSATKEAATWFTYGRAIGATVAALALGGTGCAVEYADGPDNAAPKIQADGFHFSRSMEDADSGNNDVVIDRLFYGSCAFRDVVAHISTISGGISDVSNYIIRVNAQTVTVQNADELRSRMPNLHC